MRTLVVLAVAVVIGVGLTARASRVDVGAGQTAATVDIAAERLRARTAIAKG